MSNIQIAPQNFSKLEDFRALLRNYEEKILKEKRKKYKIKFIQFVKENDEIGKRNDTEKEFEKREECVENKNVFKDKLKCKFEREKLMKLSNL